MVISSNRMHIPLSSGKKPAPIHADTGHQEEQSSPNLATNIFLSIREWLASHIMSENSLNLPYVFLRKHIWSRLLRVVPHRRRWSGNIDWKHILHIVEEVFWIAALAGATYTVEKLAPTFNFSQRTIQLRPSQTGKFLPPSELLYPYQRGPKWVTTIYNAIIVILGPTLIFMMFQLKIGSLYDFQAALAGTLKALSMA